jgi:hypothetical protein
VFIFKVELIKMNYVRKAVKIFIFLLIALPVLGVLTLGKLFFKQGNVSKDDFFINKANADFPYGSCGGSCDGGNCGSNSGSSGNSCGASASDDCCGGCGSSGDGGGSSAGGY